MSTLNPELARMASVLQRIARERAHAHRAAHRRRLRTGGLAVLTMLVAASAAVAGGVHLTSLLPGYSVASTPTLPDSDVAATLAPAPAPGDSDAPPQLASQATLKALAGFGVDLDQLHYARSSSLGVGVLIAPRIGGGVCVVYVLLQGTTTQCGDEQSLESGGRLSDPAGRPIYVGLRPDGVTSVTALDGTSIPVINNVFISDTPIAQ